MRVIVTGGRNARDVAFIWHNLDKLDSEIGPIMFLAEGASDDVTGPYRGVDFWAHKWACAKNIQTRRFHANWTTYGKAAGPIRNGIMLKEINPNAVIAFPGGTGTRDMITKAAAAHIEVINIRR